ncbi:hypothetical protein Acor_64560 [Acrocarpospora corrugata]|uniref:Uncharacterized protein n=1 Tax=Acrocarpospora corrugata TaxID=35763 RepID=A0A5M3WD82_9ACTN|nr:DUF6247 family protein [Acrocarpospora corrugata]GES04388.1 hypothetical protein Acor_64560 [Acrocarpospora corrugata]
MSDSPSGGDTKPGWGGYLETMSAERAESVGHEVSDASRVVLPKNLRTIRDALLPEDVGDFDREFRHLMAEATESLDLGPLTEFSERWSRWAQLSADPVAHRKMLDQVRRLNQGEDVPALSRAEVEARLGL